MHAVDRMCWLPRERPAVSFLPSPVPELPSPNGILSPPSAARPHSEREFWLERPHRDPCRSGTLASGEGDRSRKQTHRPGGLPPNGSVRNSPERLSRLVSASRVSGASVACAAPGATRIPVPRGVSAGGPTSAACFEGLSESLRNVEAGEAEQRSCWRCWESLLDLLVGFIGEELTLRLVREVWPDLPLLEAKPDHEIPTARRLPHDCRRHGPTHHRRSRTAWPSTSCRPACAGWTRCLAVGFPNTAST